MNIKLLLDKEQMKFIKDNCIDVRDSLAKIIIADKEYDCIYENYSSNFYKRIKSKKTFNKITLKDILLSKEIVEQIFKNQEDILINEVKHYAEFEISGFTCENEIMIKQLVFREY